MAKQMTFGVIVGNRGFFPDHLAKTGREEILRVLAAAGIRTIALTPEESKFGAVETPTEARLCGDLFRKQNRVAKLFSGRGRQGLGSQPGIFSSRLQGSFARVGFIGGAE